MTKEQSKKLMAAIRQLVRAEIAVSWIGSQDPADHASIEADLCKSKARVNMLIHSLVEPK